MQFSFHLQYFLRDANIEKIFLLKRLIVNILYEAGIFDNLSSASAGLSDLLIYYSYLQHLITFFINRYEIASSCLPARPVRRARNDNRCVIMNVALCHCERSALSLGA
jgi:hypothetical protein